MGATLPSVFYSFGGSLFSASTPVAYQVIRANSAATAFELVTVYSRSETDGGFVALTGTQTVAGSKTFTANSTVYTPGSNGQDTIRVNAAAGTPAVQIGSFSGVPTYGLITLGNWTPSATNFQFAGTNTETIINVGSGGNISFRVANSNQMVVKSAGILLLNGATDDTINKLQVNGGVSIAGTAPASAAATGAVGSIRWDSGFIYICTATNTWKRVAIATW